MWRTSRRCGGDAIAIDADVSLTWADFRFPPRRQRGPRRPGSFSRIKSVGSTCPGAITPVTQLAIFGASGRTGGKLVDLARTSGIGVRVLVRPAAVFEARQGVLVLRGSLEDAGDLARTVSGATAVGCAFGPRKTSEPAFCARVTAHLIASMKAAGVPRLVCLTGAMVGELPPNVSRPMRWMAGLYRDRVPHLAADASEQERLVMQSGLDWTLAKPPRLTDGPATGRYRADPGLRVGLRSRISRSDLAAFLLDELRFSRHNRQRVYVSS